MDKKKKVKLDFTQPSQPALAPTPGENVYIDDSANELLKLKLEAERRRQQRMNELDGEDSMQLDMRPADQIDDQTKFELLRKLLKG